MEIIEGSQTDMSVRNRWLRMAAGVQRYHTWPMHTRQDLAAHSYGVAVLLDLLVPEPSPNLFRAALYHDLSEFVTGDIPSPAKRAYPDMKRAVNEVSTDVEIKMGIRPALSTFEQQALRWCDMAELVLHSLHEMKMGNRYADIMVRNGLQALQDYKHFNMKAAELHGELTAIYQDYKDGIWE